MDINSTKKTSKNKCCYCNSYTDLFFCPKCGCILKYPNYVKDDKSLEGGLQSYVKSLVKDAIEKGVDLSTYSDLNVLSGEVFREYNDLIFFLQKTHYQSNDLLTNDQDRLSVIELMKTFADKCKNSDCLIAIAGRTGSGKSTFINALLGNDFFFTEPSNYISVLTKIRHSRKLNYIKISYYKTDEWNLLWNSAISANQDSIRNENEGFLFEYGKLDADVLRSQLLDKHDEIIFPSNDNELKKLISSYLYYNNPHRFFVKEIEIGLFSYPFPKNVVLVDTLGIDDSVPYRTIISNQYISTANIILLCVKAANAYLHPYELDSISKIFSLTKSKKQVYLIGSQYDIPNEFPKYWKEKTYPEFINQITAQSFYGSEYAKSNRLFPISAWYYYIIQKAKNDTTFDNNECNVDYLAEILCRCLGNSVAYQYGTDGTALKRCMNEHLPELESMTNLPYVIDYFMHDSIREYNKKTNEDFKNVYLNIIRKIGNEIAPQESIYSSRLISEMLAFDSKKIQKITANSAKDTSINATLLSFQNRINNIKNT